jgi:hypothetical protein
MPRGGEEVLPVERHRTREIVYIALGQFHGTRTVMLEIQSALVAPHNTKQRRPVRPPASVKWTAMHRPMHKVFPVRSPRRCQ